MLNISAKETPCDVSQLSDAELISTLAQQAKELGISIDLNYTFHQPKKTDESAVSGLLYSTQALCEARARASMPGPQLRRCRVRSRQYNHGRANSDTAVKILDVLVGETNATRGHEAPDG